MSARYLNLATTLETHATNVMLNWFQTKHIRGQGTALLKRQIREKLLECCGRHALPAFICF